MLDIVKEFLNLNRRTFDEENIICEKAIEFITKTTNIKPNLKKECNNRTLINTIIFLCAFSKISEFRKWLIEMQFLTNQFRNCSIPIELLQKERNFKRKKYNYLCTEESINFHIQLELYTDEFLIDGTNPKNIIKKISQNVFW